MSDRSTVHLIDFQILLQNGGQINFGLSLEESIIKGLGYTGSYNYGTQSTSTNRKMRQAASEIIKIIPLRRRFLQPMGLFVATIQHNTMANIFFKRAAN